MTKHPTPETNLHSSHSVDGADSNHQAIAARAYQKYLASGQKDGHDVENWLKAEQELQAEQRTSPDSDQSEPDKAQAEVAVTDFVSLQ